MEIKTTPLWSRRCHRVHKELTELGCERSKLDHEFYYYKEGGQLKGVVMVHVDNLLYAGTDKFQENIMDEYTKMFTAGSKTGADLDL